MNITVRNTCLFLVFITSFFACDKQKESNQEESPKTSKINLVDSITKPLDGFILQVMEKQQIVGLGAAIIVDKELVWIKGFGFADKEKQIAFTPNTVMCIASISKTFTGATLMKAVEDGLVSLDEDINNYLPFK
ncbi:MAG: beta-lactamase family protein, partial [Cytophagales bacterium]|nr:beta-lactamase family protein [Cytophagales bacterium]